MSPEKERAAVSPDAEVVHEKVVDYYNNTYWQYRIIWLNPQNRSMHYGYWDEKVKNHAQSMLRMNEVLAERAPLAEGMRVLDAGCGVGGGSLWLAEHHPVQVEGVTLAQSQVERASRYAAERGVAERVHFSVQDYCATQFPEASFDRVWAVESLCHAPDKKAFAREAYRLLKPGGYVLVADFFRSAEHLTPAGEKGLQAWLETWAVPDLVTISGLAETFKSAGLELVSAEDDTAKVWRSAVRLARWGYVAWPVVQVGKALRLMNQTAVRNYQSSLLQYRALKQGLWQHGLVVARKPES